jgi:hypothetical protein
VITDVTTSPHDSSRTLIQTFYDRFRALHHIILLSLVDSFDAPVTMTDSETPTVQEMNKWDAERVLGWIQGRNSKTLTEVDVDNFNQANFSGGNFLLSDFEFFRVCGISHGASRALGNLVKEVKEKGKFILRTQLRP